MSDLLDYFEDMEVSVTPVIVTETKDSKGQKKRDKNEEDDLIGLFFYPSRAAVYFGNRWSEDISAVFTTKNVGNLKKGCEVLFNTKTYNVEDIEDPGSMNISGWDNVYLVALRGVD